MNIKRYILAIAVASLLTTPLSAKKKPFYNSKSNIVCIAGDYDLLEYANKFRKVPVPVQRAGITKSNYGKQILDYLFCYDGKTLSEERLKDLALQNVLKSDDERASIGVISKDDILKEDYLPILENNYIFFVENKMWYVYKVEIDKDILDQVFNCWNDMDRYNQITVPITFVSSGKAKTHTDYNTKQKELKNKTKRHIAVKVPAFAIRGQVTGRNPFTTDMGSTMGLKDCDQVAIYRAKEKNGTMYSSKVSTTRACNVADSTANLYTFAGGQASYKKGDVAVYQPSKNMSFSLSGEYMDHSYGAALTWDWRTSLSKAGMSQYIILKLGAGTYENYGKRLYATNTDDVVQTPIYMNFGLGYGLGFEFAHCLELVPYLMAQWESLYFANKYEGTQYTGLGNAYHAEYSGKSVWTKAVRVPIGVKLNVNVCYPVQLTVGAEYVLNFSLDKIDDDDNTKSNAERFFFNPTGYKRSGMNIYAGLRFNF